LNRAAPTYDSRVPIPRKAPKYPPSFDQSSDDLTLGYDSDPVYSDEEDDEEVDPFALQNRVFPPTLPAISRQIIRYSPESITSKIIDTIAEFHEHDIRSMSISSGSGSDTEGVSDHPEAAVQNLWFQLKDSRQRLNDVRTRMATKRRQLRELRRWKDEADNAFMALLRPILAKSRRGPGSADDLVEKRLLEMQRLRSDYGFLESEYEGLEIQLDEEEIEQDKLETRFFSLLASGHTDGFRRTKKEKEAESAKVEKLPQMPYDLSGISPDRPAESIHPLFSDLLSAMGDLELAKEELSDLMLRREQILYDIDMKKKAGKNMNREEWEFLNEYPEDEAEKKDTLERLTREVGKLRELCEKRGVMMKNLDFKTAFALNPTVVEEDMSLDPQPRDTLANPRFPRLLSQPDHLLLSGFPRTAEQALAEATKLALDDPTRRRRLENATKEFGIHVDLLKNIKDDSKGSFVTRWMLHQLRTSPLAVELLYSTFAANLKVMDPDMWQADVLFYWWRDKGNLASEELKGPLTGFDNDPFIRARSPSPSRACSVDFEIQNRPRAARPARVDRTDRAISWNEDDDESRTI
jgi:hypothetical protein